jgi:hypothetical protein
MPQTGLDTLSTCTEPGDPHYNRPRHVSTEHLDQARPEKGHQGHDLGMGAPMPRVLLPLSSFGHWASSSACDFATMWINLVEIDWFGLLSIFPLFCHGPKECLSFL